MQEEKFIWIDSPIFISPGVQDIFMWLERKLHCSNGKENTFACTEDILNSFLIHTVIQYWQNVQLLKSCFFSLIFKQNYVTIFFYRLTTQKFFEIPTYINSNQSNVSFESRDNSFRNLLREHWQLWKKKKVQKKEWKKKRKTEKRYVKFPTLGEKSWQSFRDQQLLHLLRKDGFTSALSTTDISPCS